MKRIFLSFIIIVSALGVNAQDTEYNRMKQEIVRTFHKRVYSNEYPLRKLPTASKSSYKGDAPKALPQDRVWFPGEWEEVKAIIVTPSYDYLVPGHESSNYWYAQPVVEGYADYYQYTMGAWRNEGMGPYITRMDTTSNFGKVFFHIMDGIQMGGAEAWVHVEQLSDTAIVHRTLARMNLRHDKLRFICGPGNSIWYRDCGPICFYYGDQDSLAMLDFIYSRHRRPLDDSIPSLLMRQMGIPNYMNKVLWEGGNCLVDGAGMVVSSDAVYTINADTLGQITWDGNDINTLHYEYKPAMTPDQVEQALHDMLGQRATHIVPRFLYDGSTGHVDLYLDAYDENGFVFSCMPEKYRLWADYITEQNNIDSLCSYKSLFGRDYYKMACLPFPSADGGRDFASQEEYDMRYSRTYANHTFVNNVILQPCFSAVGADRMPTEAWDRANIEAIKEAYPGYTIYPIDVRAFDGSGGAIHCVTKQIPADNPVRILHKNIHGEVSADLMGNELPVSAIITNRDGIAHAEVVYRLNGEGDWMTIDLTGNGNRWYGQFSFNNAKTVVSSVEYYISATSNNGKTVTKPITASQGGYYRFDFSDEGSNDSDLFDFDTLPIPMENITFTFGNSWLTEDTTGRGHGSLAIGTVDSDELFGQFYPNPAADKANIVITFAEDADYRVTILDQSGRTIHTSKLSVGEHASRWSQMNGTIEYTINTSRLASGIYHVVFSDDRHTIVRRLIVK